jgi:hypothetical protein
MVWRELSLIYVNTRGFIPSSVADDRKPAQPAVARSQAGALPAMNAEAANPMSGPPFCNDPPDRRGRL